MKVLLTGAKGMLARAIKNNVRDDWDLCAVDIDELDIADRGAVQDTLRKLKPECIINCAAFTQVDACEAEKERAFSVNGEGLGYIAATAQEIGATLVHFSTDYIFNGARNRPYKEDDPVSPINVYGASKWEGECKIRKHLDKHLIIRTQWLYGNGGNHFIKTILNLAKNKKILNIVDDQIGSPTWTEDIAKATLELIDREAQGTYHVVNSGHCSWYGFARKIVDEASLSVKLVPCSTDEYPCPAQRPAYSVLSTKKAQEELGYFFPPWELSLKQYMLSKSE